MELPPTLSTDLVLVPTLQGTSSLHIVLCFATPGRSSSLTAGSFAMSTRWNWPILFMCVWSCVYVYVCEPASVHTHAHQRATSGGICSLGGLHLVFLDRARHWPGTHSLCSGGWPASPRDLRVSILPRTPVCLCLGDQRGGCWMSGFATLSELLH